MKKLLLSIILTSSFCFCFGQKNLLSYEDLRYLLHNNLQKADTFLMAKGYTPTIKNTKKKTSEYTLSLKNGTHVTLSLRADGKKIFMELETNELAQYDLINNSISQYIHKSGMTGDIQTYEVKNLGNIYISVNESVPYDPLKKDYVMQIVADKNIVAYD